MTSRSRRPLRLAALLLLLGMALSACSAVQPIAPDSAQASTAAASASAAAPSAAASPSAETSAAPSAAAASVAASPGASAAASGAATGDDAAVIAKIQETLDTYAKAFNDQDQSLLAQVVDPKSGVMKRFVTTRYQNVQDSVFGGGGTYKYTVQQITRRPFDFVTAEIETNGLLAYWTFKQVGDKWLMSEPTEQQLGDREKVETDHFIFYMYPWTEEVNATLMKEMETAREQVLAKLGKVPDKKADVYIKPTFGVGATTSVNVLAFYSPPARGNDRMVIVAPKSYTFPFYDPSVGWEAEVQTTLTHEYAHLVNNRSFTPISRLREWMTEGLAVYVSDDTGYDNLVRAAVDADKVIPIIDTSGQVNKQDLEHLTILNTKEQVVTAYGLGKTIVQYINEKYGGMDGFWKFADAFDKKQNMDAALQEAFGISYEQFDKDWRAWLKENY